MSNRIINKQNSHMRRCEEPDTPVNNLASYHFEEQIGRGASGTCYKASHISSGNVYAIKKITINSLKRNSLKQAMKQVSILKSLKHPHIINDDTSLYIVMEYATKGDLHSILKRRKIKQQFWQEKQIWQMARQLLDALNYLHENKIVHRDFKTLNIFMGEKNRLMVGDLGVSKIIKADLGLYSRVGTPLYLAPQIIKYQKYDYKADVWGLGCVLYLMTTLRHPFEGKNIISLGQNIVHTDPKPIVGYSELLSNLIMSMLKKQASKRPQPRKLISLYYANEGEQCSVGDAKQQSTEKNNITSKTILNNNDEMGIKQQQDQNMETKTHHKYKRGSSMVRSNSINSNSRYRNSYNGDNSKKVNKLEAAVFTINNIKQSNQKQSAKIIKNQNSKSVYTRIEQLVNNNYPTSSKTKASGSPQKQQQNSKQGSIKAIQEIAQPINNPQYNNCSRLRKSTTKGNLQKSKIITSGSSFSTRKCNIYHINNDDLTVLLKNSNGDTGNSKNISNARMIRNNVSNISKVYYVNKCDVSSVRGSAKNSNANRGEENSNEQTQPKDSNDKLSNNFMPDSPNKPYTGNNKSTNIFKKEQSSFQLFQNRNTHFRHSGVVKTEQEHNAAHQNNKQHMQKRRNIHSAKPTPQTTHNFHTMRHYDNSNQVAVGNINKMFCQSVQNQVPRQSLMARERPKSSVGRNQLKGHRELKYIKKKNNLLEDEDKQEFMSNQFYDRRTDSHIVDLHVRTQMLKKPELLILN